MNRVGIYVPGLSLEVTAGVIFEAGLDVSIVESVILTNTDVVARTVNLYVRKNREATSRRILPKNHSLAAGMFVAFDTPLTLNNGDVLLADASAASVVDCTVSAYSPRS